jgi:hypothetical protein
MLNSGLPAVPLPLIHRFLPGLYAREILMPAGTLLTSKIHNTEHPYVVLSGRVRVFVPGEGVVILEAGHVGITKPGTKRLLFIEEDCRWITFHPLTPEDETRRREGASEQTLVAEVEERIIERVELPGDGGRTAFDLYQEALAAGLLEGEAP